MVSNALRTTLKTCLCASAIELAWFAKSRRFGRAHLALSFLKRMRHNPRAFCSQASSCLPWSRSMGSLRSLGLSRCFSDLAGELLARLSEALLREVVNRLHQVTHELHEILVLSHATNLNESMASGRIPSMGTLGEFQKPSSLMFVLSLSWLSF